MRSGNPGIFRALRGEYNVAEAEARDENQAADLRNSDRFVCCMPHYAGTGKPFDRIECGRPGICQHRR